jgi:hypothetical protein
MDVSIKTVGFVKAITAVQAIGEAGKAVQGSLATFGSLLPYASFIETGRSNKPQVRRAGPARMFARGGAEAVRFAVTVLPAAIVKGPRSVGQAKRKVRDFGTARIRQYTPVRSGRLRASVHALERPR